MTARRISLYVHVPFCRRRCPYCTFYHVPLAGEDARRSFVEALLLELDAAVAEIGEPFSVPTVFVGGGTPSIIGSAALGKILERVRSRLSGPDVEMTIELNPEDIDGPMLDDLGGLGFNRVSLGIQSMSERAQRALGRCSPRGNLRALELVSSRFENYSVDLLLGIPSSRADELRGTLESIGSFAPPHLSVYCLEPGGDISETSRGFFEHVDADVCAEEYLAACAALESSGYAHYEVSNFAMKGRECAHNFVYWRGAEYLGLGPGAHSFVGGERFHNAPDLDAYLDRREDLPRGVRVSDPRTGAERDLERLMLSLRTSDGVALSSIPGGAAAVDSFVRDDLAKRDRTHVRLTDRGYLVLNEIVHRLRASARPAPR